ncbi:MAG: VWA domain-containing protein [Desulfamplus sp.]|nr:VWA domain-containing protein [Desulfamplus sp.]
MRRLPVFLLLDVSDSMIGEPLHHLEKGIDTLISKLRQDPHAIETVYISVIAFAGQVKTIVPLMDLPSFYPPRLQVGAGTSLGLALEHLMREIDKKVIKTTRERKGDWKPLIYLMTDGKPTDKCDDAISKWNKDFANRVNLVAIGLGEHASTDILRKFTDNVLSYNGEDGADFARFIEWMTMSVKSQSVKLIENQSKYEFNVSLEKVSSIVQLAKSGQTLQPDDDHVILVGRCQTKHNPYLIKYDKVPYTQILLPNASGDGKEKRYFNVSGSFPVEESYFEWSGSMTGIDPKISITSLYGTSSCPQCGNRIANGFCSCGKMFCISGAGPAQCPWCGQKAIMDFMDPDDEFEISRSRG